VIEVAISEVGERPCALLQKQSFEPIPLFARLGSVQPASRRRCSFPTTAEL
jgi:hypothetical protein